MGRRGNRNKNSGKVSTRIARKKFRQSICSKCQLCHPNTGMNLCYNKLYLKNPEIFINIVLPNLIERHAELKELKNYQFKTSVTNELQIFKEIFCDSDICEHCSGSARKQLEICYTAFIAQVKQKHAIATIKNKIPVEPPVMTVIISNNDEFENEILRIIEEYNENKRSAKDIIFENNNKQVNQNNTSKSSIERHTG